MPKIKLCLLQIKSLKKDIISHGSGKCELLNKTRTTTNGEISNGTILNGTSRSETPLRQRQKENTRLNDRLHETRESDHGT